MKKLRLGAILALLTVALSCKKDEPTPPAPAVKFMSFTAGSTWSYKFTNNPSTTPAVTNYTLTATSGDSVASSKTYKIFTNSTGPNEYYNLTGSDYYTFRKLPDELGGGTIEVLYLKDNAALNDTWSQTTPISYSGLSLQLTLNNKIAQKGISKTVNGITYNDVVDVQTTLSVAGIPFAYTLNSTIHYFYAPKVGQIENTTLIDLNVTGFPATSVNQKTELQSSTIL